MARTFWNLAGGAVASVALVAILAGGCSKPKPAGPSYAEALSIYNQEVLALDRLRARRDELKKALKAPETSNLELARKLLGDTAETQQQLVGALKDLGNPGGVLKNGETDRQQKELIGAVQQQIDKTQQGEEKKAQQWQQEKKKIEARIAKLDQQIAAQKKRVERAKADKDAAEAARK